MLRAANRGHGTIRLHVHKLSQLSYVHPDPWAVTVSDLRESLARPSWGAESRKSARTVYRGFYGWALSMKYVDESPAEHLATVRVPIAEPRPAPEWAVAEAFVLEDDRLRFMAMLAGYAGLRAAEIARVHADDWDGLRLLVHGKGGHERLLPLRQPDLAAALSGVRGWAFPSPWADSGHLTPGHVTRLLSRAIPGMWTAHTFRHRAATRAHDGTKDIFAVSKMLGHSRVETTQRYVRVSDDAIAKALDAAAA